MKQEYWLATIIGLVIFGYVLDLLVNPLALGLPTPYHYFIAESFTTFPFTTVSIVIKAAAVFIAPLLALSFSEISKTFKGIILLVISGLLQLYALQDVAAGTHTIPLEWAISLTLAGVFLLIPMVIFLVIGFLGGGQKHETPHLTSDQSEDLDY